MIWGEFMKFRKEGKAREIDAENCEIKQKTKFKRTCLKRHKNKNARKRNSCLVALLSLPLSLSLSLWNDTFAAQHLRTILWKIWSSRYLTVCCCSSVHVAFAEQVRNGAVKQERLCAAENESKSTSSGVLLNDKLLTDCSFFTDELRENNVVLWSWQVSFLLTSNPDQFWNSTGLKISLFMIHVKNSVDVKFVPWSTMGVF